MNPHPFYHLPHGTKFYVINGNWEGTLIDRAGVRCVHIPERGATIPVTDELLEGLRFTINHQ